MKTKQRVRDEEEETPTVRKYFRPDIDAVRKKMAQMKSRRSSMWKPVTGKNMIRILPPWSKSGQWFKEAMAHWVDAPGGGGKRRMIGCPTLGGERCAICERRAKYGESSSLKKQKMSEKLAPSLSFHVNMVDLKDPEAGVQTARLTEKTIGDLLEYFMDPEWGDFTSPKKGHSLILVREGEGMQTKYSIKPQRNSSPLDDMGWLDSINDLDKSFRTPTFAETVAFLRELDGEDADEDEDEDDDEKPLKKRRPRQTTDDEEDD